MPVLDLVVWIDSDKIRHSFYKKPMACPFLILERSAIPNKIKRDTLLQEGLRRLRNMDINISEIEKTQVMT